MTRRMLWIAVMLVLGPSVVHVGAQTGRGERPDFGTLRDRRAQLISEIEAVREDVGRAALRQLPPSSEIEEYLRKASEETDSIKQEPRRGEEARRPGPT